MSEQNRIRRNYEYLAKQLSDMVSGIKNWVETDPSDYDLDDGDIGSGIVDSTGWQEVILGITYANKKCYITLCATDGSVDNRIMVRETSCSNDGYRGVCTQRASAQAKSNIWVIPDDDGKIDLGFPDIAPSSFTSFGIVVIFYHD